MNWEASGVTWLDLQPGFNPWVGKLHWRRERLPTPVFWPGEFHGLYSPWGHKGSDMAEQLSLSSCLQASQVAQWVKNPPPMQETQADKRSIPRLGRFPEGGHGNPVQYSFLENPMDRGAWQPIAHRVAKNQTCLKQLSMHACLLSSV